MRTPALIALGAVVVLAVGCSTRSSKPVATTHISMATSYRFDPDVIRVRAGSTVTWTNNDNFTHTVKVDGRPDHTVHRGDSFSEQFDSPGRYHYVCTLHSHDMQGTVIVR